MFHVHIEDGPPSPTMPGNVSPSMIAGSGASQPDVIRFFSGNPLVEVTRGVLHLYKPRASTIEGGNKRPWQVVGHRRRHTETEPIDPNQLPPDEERSKLVCVLAVPEYMCVADFVQFTAAHQSAMSRVRVVRGSSPGKYLVLVYFKEQKDADDFYLEYNGKKFSSIAEEECLVVFVNEASDLTNVPPTCELPTCPVCLERLDSSASGIMTIICNHSFHSECLARWSDNTCPVCRHCQHPEAQESHCQVCGTSEALWICVVCGFVGCGRYKSEHAFTHFKDTGHTFSMEIETQRVWDYAADGYVHRLVQNMVDGKVVELPEPHDLPERSPEEIEDSIVYEKMDSMALEYQYLLASQLESQRSHYEGLMKEQTAVWSGERQRIESECSILREKLEQSQSRNEEMERRRQATERKRASMDKELITMAKELEFHKELVSSLNTCQGEWREQLQKQRREHESETKKLNDRITMLEEELHDLMVALDGERFIASNPELDQGDISVVPAMIPTRKGKGRRNNRK